MCALFSFSCSHTTHAGKAGVAVGITAAGLGCLAAGALSNRTGIPVTTSALAVVLLVGGVVVASKMKKKSKNPPQKLSREKFFTMLKRLNKARKWLLFLGSMMALVSAGYAVKRFVQSDSWPHRIGVVLKGCGRALLFWI